jgi:hypothetical protein
MWAMPGLVLCVFFGRNLAYFFPWFSRHIQQRKLRHTGLEGRLIKLGRETCHENGSHCRIAKVFLMPHAFQHLPSNRKSHEAEVWSGNRLLLTLHSNLWTCDLRDRLQRRKRAGDCKWLLIRYLELKYWIVTSWLADISRPASHGRINRERIDACSCCRV